MKDIEISEYHGEGYNPTMHFESWRVAIANFGEHFDKESLGFNLCINFNNSIDGNGRLCD